MILPFFNKIGAASIEICQKTGEFSVFTIRSIGLFFQSPLYFKEILSQLHKIGYKSLPVVGLTAFFTGGALALQIYEGGSRFNAESTVPSIVAIGIIRELGPVLGGLMVAGRVAAAMAAEIATMKVTEQLDALQTLSIDPLKYLVVPRVIASILSLPCLVIVGNTIGIFGGFIIGITKLNFDPSLYLLNTVEFLTLSDIASSLIKATVFGFLIAIMGCFNGLKSARGAEGVGHATTSAVVSSSIMILASNYFLTELLFQS